MNKKQKRLCIRILVAGSVFLLLNIVPLVTKWLLLNFLEYASHGMALFSFILSLVLYLAAYIIVGWDILRKAFLGMRNGRVFDENFLMTLATIGAIGLAFYENIRVTGTLDISRPLDLNEAVAVMLFYQVGELFQSVAVGKSRKNIAALMDIRPDYANVEQAGEIVRVGPAEVSVGSVIIVYPGEKIPIDGVVKEGSSTLNTSALTGESIPKDVATGDDVISGCINMTGVLQIQTTKAFGQSTVSKILELVEEASSRKSNSEQFISKFARVYTPAVTLSALALAVLPPVVRMFMGNTGMWGDWLYRALTFLVISCPCALVISIPLTFFAGIGGAGREGILIKGSHFIETLSKASVVVFDKTGTLTQGTFRVKEIRAICGNEETLLEYAAMAESASSHPISKSLLQAYGKPILPSDVSDIQEISGHGVTAKVRDGVQMAVGNARWMEKLGIFIPDSDTGVAGTTVYVAVDGIYAGYLVISDEEKPGAAQAVVALKNNGIKRTIMLTGDTEQVAKQVAAALHIDEVRSELLPADKVTEVERLLDRMAGKTDKDRPGKEGTGVRNTGSLVYVGDGINDAPVLSRADVGIAMGALGSDAAIEAADVVLMDDDPCKVASAIAMAKRIMGIVYQNIIFSLVVKFACLGLGAFGVANMWFAIFADVGVMVLAVLNATRAIVSKSIQSNT